MAKRKRGEGRGLETIEVALMKRMIMDKFPRDRIMSFFVRPGRVISPAVKSEVEKGQIGKDVEPATPEELGRFISSRLNEIRPFEDLGPLSPSRIREVISLSRDAQESLPGFENQFSEYKEDLPTDRAGRVKIAKVAASFANMRGGYIFFGIGDDRTILGVAAPERADQNFQAIFQAVSEYFMPSLTIEHTIVEVRSSLIGVIYVYEAENKPIICTKDYAEDVHKGFVYLRYSGSTRLIEPGDLLVMLHERDRRVAAREGSVETMPSQEPRFPGGASNLGRRP